MMSDADNNETSYATLGLAPDATLAQVKARYRELNNAYLKILELSRKGNVPSASQHTPVNSNALRENQQAKAGSGQTSPTQETRTEPIGVLKEKLAKGKIDKTHFERLTKERYDYLRNKPFSELSDSEFEERLTWLEEKSS